MTPFIETERLFLHHHIFEDGTVLAHVQKKGAISSSAQALSDLIKRNQSVISKVFGWWQDISSPYSAGFHIKDDLKAWRDKKQLQYYIYDKESERCIGIFCAIIDKEKKDAYVLAWLEEKSQNKGYAREVARAIEHVLFSTGLVQTISYECFDVNRYAHKVGAFLSKEGYQYMRTNFKSVVWQKKNPLSLKKARVIGSKKTGNMMFFSWLKKLFVRENI